MTEDEVRSAFDVRFRIDLCTFVSENSVLVAYKLATVVALLAGVGAEREGLRTLATGVDQVDVVDFQISGPRAQCCSGIIVERVILAPSLGNGNSIACVAGRVHSLAVYGQGGSEWLNVNLLFVYTRGDEDALRNGARSVEIVHSRLHGLELVGTADRQAA